MASSFACFLLLCFLLFYTSPSLARTPFRPKALLLPVSKDSSTLQYLTHFNQRTPLVPVKLTVDLGSAFAWIDCEKGYVSSSFRPVRCDSALCTLVNSKMCTSECYGSPKPGCHNNTCDLAPGNTVIRLSTTGQVGQDLVSLQSTNGMNPGKLVSVRNFVFSCGSTFLLEGLANGVTGMAGFGRSNISLPVQFSATFGFSKKFAICLSSSTQSNGVIFFGDSPYVMLPNNVDLSNSLTYTPLKLNPVSTAGTYFEGESSVEYFIGVKSIKINGKEVKLNKTLLSIDKEGNGGTKISTVKPYTVLETSIYKAVTKAFVKEMKGVPRVAAVAQFGVCFNSKNIGSSRVGPAVPPIDLVLEGKKVLWRIWGANSMVQVNNEVMCLGFVDGGSELVTTPVIIGGHQLEDNLLQFDLATSRLGFSSSLLFRQTTCSNFNFTSV